MENKLNKKYGLFTAISMVVGIVIGSGVFFKAEKVLNATGGNLPIGILAWLLGGVIMITCAYTFSILAQKYDNALGVSGYALVTLGKRYSYNVGWFMTTIYFPSLCGVLSWVAARYTCVLFGFDINGGEAMLISALYLIMSCSINTLSPIIAGKIQISTTIIKLIPLLLMAIIGTVKGFSNGMLVENFTTSVSEVSFGKALFSAIVATAFAYDGWIVATSISSELRNSKRNLPLALIGGSIIVVLTYMLYYIGLAGGISNELLMKSGESGVRLAFEGIFSKAGGTLLFVFVVISCLGGLNGVMLGCCRGMYSLANQNQGPRPDIFSHVDKVTGIPANSSIIGLLMSIMWTLYFFSTQLTDSWFGQYWFDISELPIISSYMLYIPIFFSIIKKEKELSLVKRFISPILSIIACIFIIIATIYSHGTSVLYYLIVFSIIMGVGNLFYSKKRI